MSRRKEPVIPAELLDQLGLVTVWFRSLEII